jgi:gliding motility-associated-like protein
VAFYVKPDICLGDTVVVALSSITSGVTNCTWNFEDANIISSTVLGTGGPYYVTWSTTGIHFIQVAVAENGECYSKTVTDTVNVHPIPDASFNITTVNGTLCLDDSVFFSANDSNYENNYSWTPVHFFGNTNIDKPSVWGKVEMAQSFVTLTVTDPFGCISSYTRELDPSACCTLVFPNAFSPNGDGKDDIFRPITIGHYPIHIFLVKNRWGQTVFETENEYTGWDGTLNGVPQDVGVYFYYIKYDCNGTTHEEKGDVTLIR